MAVRKNESFEFVEALMADLGGPRSATLHERLFWRMITRGSPTHVRSDNRSGFTAKVVRLRLARVDVQTLFIEPGSPWESGYVDSFSGRLCDELLNREVLYSLGEPRVLINDWRQEYYTIRPHGNNRLSLANTAVHYGPTGDDLTAPVLLTTPLRT